LYNPEISPDRRPREEHRMTAIEARLLQRLKQLPPSRVAEVVDFVEFLAAREERAAAAARLKEAMTRIDDLGLAPFSEDEIEAEVQAVRAAHPKNG